MSNDKFNKMFYDGVDENERAYHPIDIIPVRLVHAWNWDSLMEQVVIYSFIQYWESEGESMLDSYMKSSWNDSMCNGRGMIYQTLRSCYNRIMRKPELFFGDSLMFGKKHRYRNNTIEQIWKYRHLMWN